MTVAIKTVKADGDLVVESFDYQGLAIKNLIVPITLADGKATTVYVGKPAGQNTAAPAVANDGTLDVGNLTLDLTQDPPRLNAPAGKVVIARLDINPLFANTYLAKVLGNPIFSHASVASGVFDLSLSDCTELPLGNLVTSQTPENTGTATMLFSLTQLNIGLSGISGLSSALKQDSVSASIDNATVAVAKGFSTQHIDLASGKFSLNFDGTVRLADEALMPLNVSIGPLAGIISKFGVHDQSALKSLPDRLVLPVHGTVTDAHVDPKPLVKLAGDLVKKGVLKKVLGGKNGDDSDPLGGLLNKLGKKKKDDSQQ